MLAGLKVVSDGGDAWQVGETVLLPTGATRYWTEHSPRATLATWAQRTGVTGERFRLLGRWAGDTAQ
eukprot:4346271-Amphidinium_carterae.1